MHKLLHIYRLFNILSIDVALGAVCCGAWFANYFHVQLRPQALVSLGLTVWLIYTADHLLDARKIIGAASTIRHRFHQKHFNALLIFLLAAGIADFALLFFLRTPVIHAGMLLIGLVAIYLFLSQGLRYTKEIAVAILYSGGVMLPALSLAFSGIGLQHVTVAVCFLFTALINIMMFSWFDYEADIRDGYNSFSVKVGRVNTRKLLTVLFLMQAVFLFVLFLQSQYVPAAMLACMNTTLFVIFMRSVWFSQMEYYRLAGDLVFLIPALFLLL